MKKVIAGWLVVCGVAFAQALPIPDAPAARDVAGAKELPDPSITYKVVFDIDKGGAKFEEPSASLTALARFINTLAKNGVPADHRKIAVIFHQEGTPMILKNEEYKARYNGHDNPNIAMIQKLAKAGVDFRVCGQSVLANKIDPKTILPEIELDLWALTTLVNLEMRGYVRIGN
jgi:intracellular sulfur oxidation DsrE/DsrF family protein